MPGVSAPSSVVNHHPHGEVVGQQLRVPLDRALGEGRRPLLERDGVDGADPGAAARAEARSRAAVRAPAPWPECRRLAGDDRRAARPRRHPHAAVRDVDPVRTRSQLDRPRDAVRARVDARDGAVVPVRDPDRVGPGGDASGPAPTSIRRTTCRVSGSMRLNVRSQKLTTHTAPAPAAMPSGPAADGDRLRSRRTGPHDRDRAAAIVGDPRRAVPERDEAGMVPTGVEATSFRDRRSIRDTVSPPPESLGLVTQRYPPPMVSPSAEPGSST